MTTKREFISINADGIQPYRITVESDGRFDKKVELFNNMKDSKPLAILEDTGDGYNVIFNYKDSKKKLYLNSGQLADLMIVANILSKHYCLAGEPEFYELKGGEK